jgi:hypothetical protein
MLSLAGCKLGLVLNSRGPNPCFVDLTLWILPANCNSTVGPRDNLNRDLHGDRCITNPRNSRHSDRSRGTVKNISWKIRLVIVSDLDALNCPNCLVPMDPSGDGNAVVWECASCGLVKL